MTLECLPTEILWEIFDHIQSAIPVGYHGYYQDYKSSQYLKALRRRDGLNLAHTSSKLYYTLSPLIWKSLQVSATTPSRQHENLDLLQHVSRLDVSMSNVQQHLLSPHNVSRLVELKINCENYFPSPLLQKELGTTLALFHNHVMVDLDNVPACRLHELVEPQLLNRVQSLTFDLSELNLFCASLYSSVGKMPALKKLKSKQLTEHGEAHCFHLIKNLHVIKVIEMLPLLEELDLSDLSGDLLTMLDRNWLPPTITTLKCDWNILHALLLLNDPSMFSNIQDLTITMTRQFQQQVPIMSPFIHVERLSMLRGPSPWPQDSAVDLFASLIKYNAKLSTLTLEGISSSEISAMAPMFTDLTDISVPQIPEDSYGLGIQFTNGCLSNLQAPLNQILLSAAHSKLKHLDMHITKRGHSISYPLLESLVLNSTNETLPLTHIVVRYEITKLYERRYANPIEKIFSGFSSNKFSIHSFCTPLRSVESLNLEASYSLIKRREVFGERRLNWDPVVVDIAKLRTLLLIPPKGSRINFKPLSRELVFSSPMVAF